MKLKDKKIELLKPIFSKNEFGELTVEYETVAKVWAYFRQLSGKEVINAKNVSFEEEVLFKIGYREITSEYIIRYKNVEYNVVRIDVFEGYKEDLTLYCKQKSDKQEIAEKLFY